MSTTRIRVGEIKSSGGSGLIYDDGSSILVRKANWIATTAPAVSNDSSQGYGVSSWWYDTTGKQAYTCVDATVGAAVWRLVASNESLSNLTAGTLGVDLVVASTAKITMNAANTTARVSRINAPALLGGTNSLFYGYSTSADYLCSIGNASSGLPVLGFFCYVSGSTTVRASGTFVPSFIQADNTGNFYVSMGAAGTVDTAFTPFKLFNFQQGTFALYGMAGVGSVALSTDTSSNATLSSAAVLTLNGGTSLVASVGGLTIGSWGTTGYTSVAGYNSSTTRGTCGFKGYGNNVTGANTILFGYNSVDYLSSLGSDINGFAQLCFFAYQAGNSAQRSSATLVPSRISANTTGFSFQYAATGTVDSAITWLNIGSIDSTGLTMASGKNITGPANMLGRFGAFQAYGSSGGINALAFGFTNADWLSTIGANCSSGAPYIGLSCYQATGNTGVMNRSGTLKPSLLEILNAGTLNFKTAATGTVDSAITWLPSFIAGNGQATIYDTNGTNSVQLTVDTSGNSAINHNVAAVTFSLGFGGASIFHSFGTAGHVDFGSNTGAAPFINFWAGTVGSTNRGTVGFAGTSLLLNSISGNILHEINSVAVLTQDAIGATFTGNSSGSALVVHGGANGGRFARLDTTAFVAAGFNDLLWGYSSTYQCSLGSGSGSAIPFMGLFCYHGTPSSQMNRSNASNAPSQWKYPGSAGQVQYQYAAAGTADSAITWITLMDFSSNGYYFNNSSGINIAAFTPGDHRFYGATGGGLLSILPGSFSFFSTGSTAAVTMTVSTTGDLGFNGTTFNIGAAGAFYFSTGASMVGVTNIGSASTTQNLIQLYLSNTAGTRKGYLGFTTATNASVINEVASGTMSVGCIGSGSNTVLTLAGDTLSLSSSTGAVLQAQFNYNSAVTSFGALATTNANYLAFYLGPVGGTRKAYVGYAANASTFGIQCEVSAGILALGVAGTGTITQTVNSVLQGTWDTTGLTLATAAALNLGSTGSVTAANRQVIGTSSGISYNVPSSTVHAFQVNSTAVAQIDINGITLPSTTTAALTFGSAFGTVTSTSRQIVGTPTGMFYNTPTATAHTFGIVGAARVYTLDVLGWTMPINSQYRYVSLAVTASATFSTTIVLTSRYGILVVFDTNGSWCRMLCVNGTFTKIDGTADYVVAAPAAGQIQVVMTSTFLSFVTGTGVSRSLAYTFDCL